MKISLYDAMFSNGTDNAEEFIKSLNIPNDKTKVTAVNAEYYLEDLKRTSVNILSKKDSLTDFCKAMRHNSRPIPPVIEGICAVYDRNFAEIASNAEKANARISSIIQKNRILNKMSISLSSANMEARGGTTIYLDRDIVQAFNKKNVGEQINISNSSDDGRVLVNRRQFEIIDNWVKKEHEDSIVDISHPERFGTIKMIASMYNVLMEITNKYFKNYNDIQMNALKDYS